MTAPRTLGTSDKAVIFYRRLLLKKLQEMDEGKPLPGQDPSLDYDQRAGSFNIPTNIPWQKVVALQEQHERDIRSRRNEAEPCSIRALATAPASRSPNTPAARPAIAEVFALEHDAAHLDHVAALAEFESRMGILLDQQNGHSL